ncbi:hypothetical protein V6N13_105332 [Hibiscus sabdariffa]
MRELGLILLSIVLILATLEVVTSHGDQPLSTIAVQKATFSLNHQAYIKVSPTVLGLKGQNADWVIVEFSSPHPSVDDWIGVFSPSNFSASSCPAPADNPWVTPPLLCLAPIKYQYANYSTPKYKETGKGTLKLQLINQRSDFSFALFSGGLLNPKVVAVSNKVVFSNPKAPVYPRLAQGKVWNEVSPVSLNLHEKCRRPCTACVRYQHKSFSLYCIACVSCPAYYYSVFELTFSRGDNAQMTVTWTSGYGIGEAVPFVEWGPKGGPPMCSPAGTLTFDRNSMCGEPARTVGWRDPGFIHTGFLKELWPNTLYTYKLGHILSDGTFVWSQEYKFRASPYPGQNSLQRVIIFGDMGKAEVDGSNEYNDFQHGSLNTTKQLIRDLNNTDLIFLIGDICYANGYLSQWDQFTAQVEPIASAVPFMIASGNHERDWPGSGSFYENKDSGGECGVLAETMFYAPTENRAKFWYSTDYGMFRFCVADTEHDWREGTEQFKFIEHCLASVDRQKQPWLIFLAHRVLGYSSATFYADKGSFGEPMGRESLQKLWQKYKVDIAIYGHAHHYERTCPIYQNICTNKEKQHYTGPMNGTIHVVAGGGGAGLAKFTTLNTKWSFFKDYDYGFVKLTAFDHSNLLFEYKKSSDGKVYDSFTISRDYRDILACTVDNCPKRRLRSEAASDDYEFDFSKCFNVPKQCLELLKCESPNSSWKWRPDWGFQLDIGHENGASKSSNTDTEESDGSGIKLCVVTGSNLFSFKLEVFDAIESSKRLSSERLRLSSSSLSSSSGSSMDDRSRANAEVSEPRSGIASTSYAKPDDGHHDSSGAASNSQGPSNMHEPTLTQSPPLQVMDRVEGGLNRTPTSVFNSRKAENLAGWSIASNDSLFSIQIGSTTLSRDQSLNFNSADFPKDELFILSTSPAASPLEPDKTSFEFDKIPDYTVEDKTRPSAEEPTGEKPTHFWNSPSPSRFSVETGTSEQSFAFPM